MTMYILVREPVPLGFALLADAHSSLAAYLRFRDPPEVAAWLYGPFARVVCRVSDEEFERARAFEGSVVLTESALVGQEDAIAFRPREEWPEAFRCFKLYRRAERAGRPLPFSSIRDDVGQAGLGDGPREKPLAASRGEG